MPAIIRKALTLYGPLQASENINNRLHRTILYGSIYLADDQLVVSQDVHGIPAVRFSGIHHPQDGARRYVRQLSRQLRERLVGGHAACVAERGLIRGPDLDECDRSTQASQ